MTRRIKWGRRRIALALAAALIALASGWYWGSPWWTLWRMREAARAGDMGRLAHYIDLPQISGRTRIEARESWRSLLRLARPETESGREFIRYAREVLAYTDSEAFAPVDFRPWLAGIPIRFAGDPDPTHYRPYLVRYGLDRFEVREEGADWETGPLLTFRREGLGWRLVGVRWGQQ